MTHSRFGWVTVAVLVVGSVVLAACETATSGPAGSSRPVATVGAAEISRERLMADIPAFQFLAGASDAPCGKPADGSSGDDACLRYVLSVDIQEQIVKAYALEHDIVVAPSDVANAIAQLEADFGGAGAVDTALDAAGLTRWGLQELAQRLLLSNEVQRAVARDHMDEDALPALYETLKSRFTTIEVKHILLETRAEAQDVATHATSENFGELAAERSIDSSTASAGGSLGSLTEAQFREQFDPAFVEATLALEPGEISGVVRTRFGFHVIELVSRTLSTFDQVHDQLVAQQRSDIYAGWLRDQYNSLEILVDPAIGQLDVATGQVVPIGST